MRVLAVTNMYPSQKNPTAGTFVEQQIESLKHSGLYVEVLFIDRLKYGRSVYLKLENLLKESVCRFNPDILHVMYGGIMAEITTRKIKDRPVVITFHGADLLGEFYSRPYRRFSAGCNVIASHIAARRADGVIVVSEQLKRKISRKMEQHKIWVIPCGIDLNRFKPLDVVECRDKLGWNSDVFHVLFPSHWGNRVKRFELAKSAVTNLRRRGISAELHQLNGIVNDQVPVWLNACDALILTSFEEGSPTIVKEALACNKPVVSVDVGDVRERLAGVKGCFLALPDPQDLSKKLLWIYENRPMVQSRSSIEEFSLGRIAGRIMDVYSTVIRRRKSEY